MTTQEHSRTYVCTVDKITEAMKLEVPGGYYVSEVYTDSEFIGKEVTYVYVVLRKDEEDYQDDTA